MNAMMLAMGLLGLGLYIYVLLSIFAASMASKGLRLAKL